MPPCHGGDRGFESPRGRQFNIPRDKLAIIHLEERFELRSWLHRHDFFALQPDLLEEAAG